MDPTGKAARVARSRQACIGCRSTKQKCDGPSVIPCRRCQLYSIVCEYPPSTGPAPSKPAAARPAAPSAPIQPLYTPVQSSSKAQDTLANDRFREISERLRSIENSLSQVNLSSSGTAHLHTHDHSPTSLPSLNHSTSSPDSSANSPPDEVPHLTGVHGVQNPLQTISDALGLMDAKDKEEEKRSSAPQSPEAWLRDLQSGGGAANMSMGLSSVFDGMLKPDAIIRGIMSAEECAASFRIFHRLLAPWVMFFDREKDASAAEMRERSPILFHVMLLSTAYYLCSSSERGMTVYHALMALVNELVAPILISTQVTSLKTDLVRALNLLMLFKPIQFATLHAQGITDRAQAEQISKLNGSSSATLYSLTIRVAFATSLQLSPNHFAKVFLPGTPPPPATLGDLRLWLWLCVVDTHGALTTGRAISVDMNEALRVTRMLAALKAQPADARLAATVELYGVAKGAISSHWYKAGGTAPIPAYELRKFNRELDEWEAYWRPEMLLAAELGDLYAMTVVNTFANLVRLIVNSCVFTRWRYERKLSLSRGGDGLPELTSEDWSFIQRTLDATEHLIFSVSVESRVRGSAIDRAVQWPRREKGEARKRLTVDQSVVDTHRTAIDPITTVSYIYPLILVAKMANAGLVRCELVCVEESYARRERPMAPQRLVEGAKLIVLFRLGADFLTALAPTPTHPAHKHARMLRMIVAAGTLGQREPMAPPEAFEEFPVGRLLAVLAPRGEQEAAVQEEGAGEGGTFALPPLPAPATTAPPTVIPPEAGLALASILSGIQPSYFGDVADPSTSTSSASHYSLSSNDGGVAAGGASNILFEDLGGSLSAMDVEVDWEGLERSMREAEEGGGGAPGVASVEEQWQGYFFGEAGGGVTAAAVA